MKRWVFRLGLISAFALASINCGAVTAEEACEDHRAALNRVAGRCGLAAVPEVWLTWASGPCEGQTTSCATVLRVPEPDLLYERCIPALDAMACPDPMLPPSYPLSCDIEYEAYERGPTSCSF